MVSEMANKYELMGKEGAPMEADDVRGLGCEAVLALRLWDLLRGTYAQYALDYARGGGGDAAAIGRGERLIVTEKRAGGVHWFRTKAGKWLNAETPPASLCIKCKNAKVPWHDKHWHFQCPEQKWELVDISDPRSESAVGAGAGGGGTTGGGGFQRCVCVRPSPIRDGDGTGKCSSLEPGQDSRTGRGGY